jgi:hypothetical protein
MRSMYGSRCLLESSRASSLQQYRERNVGEMGRHWRRLVRTSEHLRGITLLWIPDIGLDVSKH